MYVCMCATYHVYHTDSLSLRLVFLHWYDSAGSVPRRPQFVSGNGTTYMTHIPEKTPFFVVTTVFMYLSQITNFIDEALEKGDSVLMHSFRGTGRCIACASAYLMFRHRWGFEKALDFLCSKRSDAAPNAGIVQQVRWSNLKTRHQR